MADNGRSLRDGLSSTTEPVPVSALRASIPNAGDWHYCGASRGGCSCMTVMFRDYPICRITSGDWGDDYPDIRLVGDSSLDAKAEAYMEQITYGSIDEEQAKVHAFLIQGAPDLFHACSAAFDFLGGVDGAAEVRGEDRE